MVKMVLWYKERTLLFETAAFCYWLLCRL